MPRLTLTDYAKHRGCYPRAVEAAIHAGRIRREPDGMIDSEQADLDWAANTSPYRSSASKTNGQRGQQIRKALTAGKPQEPAGASAGAPAAPKTEPTDMGAYARARAQREQHNADMAKLNLDRMQGKLILREEWVAAETEFWKAFRDALLAVPDRLRDELAAETDPGRVHAMLDAELRSCMEQAVAMREQRRIANG